ncbi:hypothetical protein MBLNU230_g6843t1 [Neophaeotheca triangularis]
MFTTLLALAAAATTVVASPVPQVPTNLPLSNITAPVNETTPAGAIEICGSQPYYQTAYTCYDDIYLCPVINNRRTQACLDACFDPQQYNCVNGMLMQVSNGRFLNGTLANTDAESGDGSVAPVVNGTIAR